jgi:hypothetical protein
MNTQELADKLRQTWNIADGDPHTEWDDLHPRSQEAYLAVARRAELLCANKPIDSLSSVLRMCGIATHGDFGDLVTLPDGTNRCLREALSSKNVAGLFRALFSPTQQEALLNKILEGDVLSRMKADYESIAKANRDIVDSYVKRNPAQRVSLNTHTALDSAALHAESVIWKESEKHRVVGDNIVFKGPSFYLNDHAHGVKVLLDANATLRVKIEHLEQSLAFWQSGNTHYAAMLADKDAKIRRLTEKLENAAANIERDKDIVFTEMEAEAIRLHQLWHNAQEKLNVATAYIEGLSDNTIGNWQDIKVSKNDETHTLGTLIPLLETEIKDLTRRLENAATYIEGLERDLSAVSSQRDNWKETAEQHTRNQEFYHGIVTDIGNMFGLPARLTDGGTICEDVLALKVPELVAQLIIDHEKMR